MGETGLPGLDECNYALKSAAGVNSLHSQLAIAACTLSVFVYPDSMRADRAYRHARTLGAPNRLAAIG